MKKKLFPFIILLFLSSCGYEAKYSKKSKKYYDFYISELSFIGDREINLKIKEKLNNYTLNQKDKDFKLKISSTSEKIVFAKNNSGDPTNFKIKTTVSIEVLMNKKLKNNFIIIEDFNYNNNSDKFSLRRYEKEIKNNLADTVTDKLIFRLSNIQ